MLNMLGYFSEKNIQPILVSVIFIKITVSSNRLLEKVIFMKITLTSMGWIFFSEKVLEF